MSEHTDRMFNGAFVVAILMFAAIPILLGASIAQELGFPQYYGVGIILVFPLIYGLGFGVEKLIRVS